MSSRGLILALVGLLATGALAVASPAGASFHWVEPVPGPLNVDPDSSAGTASIASVAGTPYVAWAEGNFTDNRLQVKRMNSAGTAWEEFAGPVDTNGVSANLVDIGIASVGTVPYVAWSDEVSDHDVRVKRLNSTADGWDDPTGSATPLDDGTGDASGPHIADVGGTPYVAFSDHNTTAFFVDQVRVKRLVGGSWVEPVAGPLNGDQAHEATNTSVTVLGSTLYVAWREESSASLGQIRVKRLNGSAWEEPQAGSLNIDTDREAGAPSLAVVGSTLYLAWRESNIGGVDQIRVKRLNEAGTAWTEVVPGSLNVDATRAAGRPNLASVGGVPFVAWSEPNASDVGLVRVKRLNSDETAWVEPAPGPLNVDPTQNALLPSIAGIGSVAHVVWQEGPPASSRIRVKRLVEVLDANPGGGGGTPGGGGGTGGGGGGTGGGGGGPVAIASASALALSPSVFPAAPKGASTSVKKPRRTGTTVRYRLSAAANVRFTVEKQSVGRKVARRCVKSTRSNRTKPRCTRFVAVSGSFTHTGPAGGNRFHFTGRVGGRKLTPGSYRLIATPLAADGRRGTPVRKTFRITP